MGAANTASGTGNTNTTGAGKYDWHDGRGRVRSISLATLNKRKAQKTGGASAPSASDITDEATNGLANLDPNQPMTMAQLNAGMKSAVEGKYGTARSDVQTSIRDAGWRQQAIPGYYQDYLKTLQGLQGNAQASTNSLVNATSDPNWKGLLATNGQTEYDNAGTQIGQVPQLQLGASQAEEHRIDGLRKDLSNLDTEAGDYGNQWLLDAIKNERQFGLDKDTLQVAGLKASSSQGSADARFQAKYGISMADAADGIDDSEAKTIRHYQDTIDPPKKSSHEHAPVDGVDWDVYKKMTPKQRQQAHHDFVASGRDPSASGKDQYGNTPAQVIAHQNYWDGGLNWARQYGTPDDDLLTFLQDHNVPFNYAQIIDHWARTQPGQRTGGHITQAMIDKLHKQGVKIGPGHLEMPPGATNRQTP